MAKNLQWYEKHSLWHRFRPNRCYKDRLFRFLFQDKKDLLDLYNAVNGSTYADAENLEIVTLDDVIFMKMKNDLSFLIEDHLILYAHQSTYSPNMPLRGLMYLAKQYEGLITRQKGNVYGSRLIKLPTPEYRVFYNGTEHQPNQKELFLSDAFENGRGSGCLECRAVMLNINRNHNQELLGKCKRLWEYSEFVAEVNENLAKHMSLKTAIVTAIDTCIQKGILEDVLRKNRGEVLHMLLTEYDEKQHMKTVYREGYEEGEQVGYQQGELAGYQQGELAGYQRGELAGHQQGEQDLLERQIKKKLSQKKSALIIAAELEIEVEAAEEIIANIQKTQA